MALFQVNQNKLTEIEEESIKLERDIQRLTEENMQTVFGLLFLDTEFEHDGLRLDTVAFDQTNKSFVIIEYKRSGSSSVVDQGYAYLRPLAK